jgi:hypothetical protein
MSAVFNQKINQQFEQNTGIQIRQSFAASSTLAKQIEGRIAELEGQIIPGDVGVAVTRNYGATADIKAKKLISKLTFATASVILLVVVGLVLANRKKESISTAVWGAIGALSIANVVIAVLW